LRELRDFALKATAPEIFWGGSPNLLAYISKKCTHFQSFVKEGAWRYHTAKCPKQKKTSAAKHQTTWLCQRSRAA